MDAEESFRVECSDEEIQKELKNGVYVEPSATEIIRLYEAIAKDGALPIKWNWELGRRPLTPSQDDSESDREEETEKIDTSGFDFDDEPATVRLTPRRTPGSVGPKGSAKKKTTNFENVLASVRRQKKLELREKTRFRKEKK
ncbi:uncharacterized protein LOC122256678 [Penaeus japonicus]|uniref:uncharacterized protein LOC122256678 n=1 Tax=Penaeus japonicus TaxID=27405 RepID=UPI001C710B00|nr:uncharacterized protein LOC122256678 [Penaeus japonicus]